MAFSIITLVADIREKEIVFRSLYESPIVSVLVGVDTKTDPIKPGGSVDIALSEYGYLMLKEGLVRANYSLNFRHAELRFDTVLFADGTLWYKGYIFLRDPNDPGKWIRDKKLMSP